MFSSHDSPFLARNSPELTSSGGESSTFYDLPDILSPGFEGRSGHRRENGHLNSTLPVPIKVIEHHARTDGWQGRLKYSARRSCAMTGRTVYALKCT